jgi:hypothetical protein
MLAEVFMLRLEAAARAAKEAEASSARFVPITWPATKASSGGDLIAIVCVRPAIGSRKMPLPDVDALLSHPRRAPRRASTASACTTGCEST